MFTTSNPASFLPAPPVAFKRITGKFGASICNSGTTLLQVSSPPVILNFAFGLVVPMPTLPVEYMPANVGEAVVVTD